MFFYNPFTQKHVVKVLNPALLDTVIPESVESRTFKSIDGAELLTPTEHLPFRRILSFHAICSFKLARKRLWPTDVLEE